MANKNNQALLNLKVYQSTGLSYFEATERLKQDGFTQTEINNATIALKNNKDRVEDRPQLATELLAVDKELHKQQQKGLNSTRWSFMSNGMGISTPESLSSWWPVVVIVIFGIVLLIFQFK